MRNSGLCFTINKARSSFPDCALSASLLYLLSKLPKLIFACIVSVSAINTKEAAVALLYEVSLKNHDVM